MDQSRSRPFDGPSGRSGHRRKRLAVLLVVTILVSAVNFGLGAAPAAATDPKIVGGDPVSDGQYPFQAALLALPFGNNDYLRQYCGGSLIGPFFVLTAAHCVEFIGTGPDDLFELSEFRVVVGRTVLKSTQGQRRRALRITIHPAYNTNTLVNDVAVIELKTPVSGIRPMALATTGTDALERPGRLATVTGWGSTVREEPGPTVPPPKYPNRMRVARVPIVADDECAAAYAGSGVQIVQFREICAGRTGLDTCYGDSGGPMFVPTSAGFRQIGITSFGIGCGATGFPGVYTQISSPPIGNFITDVTFGVRKG